MVELWVLGPLEAHGADGAMGLRPVERRLLGALAAGRPASVRFESLADAVWGERLPRTAQHTLHTHVQRVRMVLGADAIVTVPDGYRLGTVVIVDSDAFERAIQDAAAISAGDVERWDVAMRRWRGVPFGELVDWLPAVAERARLTELIHAAQEHRCAAAIANGPSPAIVAEAERLVEIEPLRERRWALLMNALAASGRRAEAVRTFDRARRVLATELGISPGHELSELHQSLLSTDTADLAAGPAPTSTPVLPYALSTLVGREQEVAVITTACLDHRLVTLTGVGGVGKTRVAIAVARETHANLGDHVWYVGLTAAERPGDIDELASAALGLVVTGRPVREAVIAAIGSRRVMMVLDNCEHLADAVAAFVSETVSRCPGLRVLATSRVPLRIPGERRIDVAPLAVDGAGRDLFVARAADIAVTFQTADGELLDVVSQRLAGIPLVIELAAAHVRSFGLTTLAERLASRLDIGAVEARDPVAHHRTVRAALQWSFDLLSVDQQHVFCCLGVFAGRFDLAAARAVVGEHEATDTTATVAALVDASMVVAEPDEPQQFRLLDPLRRFALDTLESRSETERVTGAHARYFTALAERLATELHGVDEVAADRSLTRVRSDLRAAARHGLATANADETLRLSVALIGYADKQVWPEPWSWCDQALLLTGATEHPLRPAALVGAASGAWQLGRHIRCVELTDEAIATTETGSDVWLEAHRVRAGAMLWLGRVNDAIDDLNRAVELERHVLNTASLNRRCTLALIRNQFGTPDRNEATQLLVDAELLGNPTCLALALHTSGVLIAPEHPDLGRDRQRSAADLAQATGAVLIHGFALAALALMTNPSDPTVQIRAITEVMNHYLHVGNHTHLRSFGRVAIGPLATRADWETIVVLDAATHDQPSFAGTADRIDDACRHAQHARTDADTLHAKGTAMTDDQLVRWLNDRYPPQRPNLT